MQRLPIVVLFLLALLVDSSEAASMSYFVTDFDGTISHYELASEVDDGRVLRLPASSGSGMIGLFSKDTLSLLKQIKEEKITIICASGQRVQTMLQRAPFFPTIDYWIW
jgi:hydroxymethylpyrimidine pyrophosphatase-like HAD family hydrolase